jgi:hypothetical protein
MLERRWPERWSPTRRDESTLEHAHADNDPFAALDELAARRRLQLDESRGAPQLVRNELWSLRDQCFESVAHLDLR